MRDTAPLKLLGPWKSPKLVADISTTLEHPRGVSLAAVFDSRAFTSRLRCVEVIASGGVRTNAKPNETLSLGIRRYLTDERGLDRHWIKAR